ncbi:MAG TPA: hypothetical protein VEH62_11810 [Gemmatimonadales bacterium]|nr:hypothetical protein [Gemmatimonadales bacterium]
MRFRRSLALVGAMAAGVLAACKDAPLAPRWDADMYMPLSTQPIRLSSTFIALTIPAGASGQVSFPAQSQDITGVLGDILKNMVTDPARCTSTGALSCDLLTLTVSKTKPIAGQDTLFVANTQANLTAAAAASGTVVFPIGVAPADVTRTDSLYLTQASVGMLQAAGQSGTPLWIQLRGQVSNPGASAIAITASDSVGLSLAVTVRVAVSHN